jgi:hypothetical protein
LNYDDEVPRVGVWTQVPSTTMKGSTHVKQLPGPGPAQLAQLVSQSLQVFPLTNLVESGHVARQRPSWKTGRLLEHDRHSVKEVPLQVPQSG